MACMACAVSLPWLLSTHVWAQNNTASRSITVSAAASLTNAFKDLAVDFEASHPGVKVQLQFAASDVLLAQIAKGAPVDAFASADQDTMDKAQEQQLLMAGTRRTFARNTLVLITPINPSVVVKTPQDLQRNAVQRFAMGKPETVPAGRYTQNALQASGLWPAVQAKAIYAQNVRQALDYVARGEVEAGFVYGSDAVALRDKVQAVATVPTPQAILYPVALVKNSTTTPAADQARAALAQQWLDYVTSPSAWPVLQRYGFSRP
ncbi:molybdate ABC transporter substrate-binding protein [Curvibacter sp. CHRR-16]|nr:molybdate ABC transporter substrate-binding protein [Curvibacter sp. CHRR-16]